MNRDNQAHEMLTRRMINAHHARVTNDRRLELIENMLHDDPPIHRQWDYARWQAERIVELIDTGVIPEAKEA